LDDLNAAGGPLFLTTPAQVEPPACSRVQWTLRRETIFMATAPTAKTARTPKSPEDLEAEIARLRDDVAKLTKQLQATGEHSYATAKRAATEGAEQLRVRGEAAMDTVRSSANDMEQQLTEAVREKPITSLAMAVGVGFFLALLSRR
jgi:ElaB/YqjD/DUF883 family membrane-anchored ribosome-binding protein